MPEISFVGRRAHLEKLATVVQRTLEGRTSIVVLAGEPGIGKTRLAEEAAERAGACGMRTHWGRCHESEGSAPYWPWIQILRSMSATWDADGGASPGGEGADLPGLLRVFGAVRPDEDSAASASSTVRIGLFDAVATLLARVSGTTPLLLALDDLHRADLASLQLLEFLSLELRKAPLLIMGTYRTVDLQPRNPLMVTLGELARRPGFSQITLEGLTEAEIGGLVTAAVTDTSLPRFTSALFRRSEGNPLYATELVKLLTEQRARSSEAGGAFLDAAVPDTLLLAIGSRIQRHTEECIQAIGIAAFLGRELDLELLTRVAVRMLAPDPAAAVDEAVHAGFLAETGGTPPRYRFTHPLIQDVFKSRVSQARRSRLHGIIGEALEERYGSRADGHAAELAHHFSRCGSPAAAGRVLRYARRAALDALDAHDYPRAMELLRQALEAKGDGEPDAETAEMLFCLGRAEILDGDETGGLRDLAGAFDLFSRFNDVSKAVEVATFPIVFDYGVRVPFDLVERIKDRVTHGTREWALVTTCRALSDFRAQPDLAATEEAIRTACDLAVGAGDGQLELYVLLAWLHVHGVFMNAADVRERLDRALLLAHARRDLRSEAVAHLCGRVYARDELDARKHLDAALFAAERFRDRSLLASVLYFAGMGHMRTGAWDKARETLDRSILLYPCFLYGGRYYRRAELEYQTGDFETGDRFLGMFLDAYGKEGDSSLFQFQTLPRAIACRAHVTGRREHLDLALSITEAILSSPSAAPHNTWMALTNASLAAAELGESGKAADLLRRIAAMGAEYGREGDSRALALVARTAGDAGSARGFFEKALTAEHRKASPPDYAWACVDFVETFGVEGDAEDRGRSRTLAAEGLGIARDLGMRPLAERAAALLPKLRDPEATLRPDGLSPREVEVLRHLAMGKTNQEISRDLFISGHTVAHHVSAVFAKIRVTNRVDAATYAVRHGIGRE